MFDNNTILTCYFFFLIIDLYFLIPAIIAQVFNPAEELVMSIEIQTKEVTAEIETHPVTAEANVSVQYNLKSYKSFCASYSSIHYTFQC